MREEDNEEESAAVSNSSIGEQKIKSNKLPKKKVIESLKIPKE